MGGGNPLFINSQNHLKNYMRGTITTFISRSCEIFHFRMYLLEKMKERITKKLNRYYNTAEIRFESARMFKIQVCPGN